MGSRVLGESPSDEEPSDDQPHSEKCDHPSSASLRVLAQRNERAKQDDEKPAAGHDEADSTLVHLRPPPAFTVPPSVTATSAATTRVRRFPVTVR